MVLINKVVKVLLVEDDVLDQIEIARALANKGILNKIKVARNGEEALMFLDNEMEIAMFGKPDIILVDLNMPRMDGFEFIAILKGREQLCDIKVFILSSSEEDSSKSKAMDFGVSGFITKPLKLDHPSSIDAFNLMIDLMNMRSSES